MFSMIFNGVRKLASSSQSERKPTGASCCNPQSERRPQQSWRHGASRCVGSGALLVLLPKCPMCIAAYLTLWTGASVAMSVATYLRPMLAILFFASILLLIVRYVPIPTRWEISMDRKPVRNKS